MRPDRQDIAAPELPGRIRWLGAERPPVMSELTAAGPVLVHFLDVAQLNSVRALPYLLEWRRRYAPLGLTMLGIHSPRFPFTSERETLDAAVAELGIEHPVADDGDYVIWHDYGVAGWPALFLWGKGGALRWAHFGEGEYAATEEAIQDELRSENVAAPLPQPMGALRATDEPGALVSPPTEEILPGGSPAAPWTAGGGPLEVDYAAGGAYAVTDGQGELRVSLDGGPVSVLPLARPGLQPLAEHPAHQAHTLSLSAGPGVRIWSISFAAGLP